jgi:integrase
LKLAAPAKGAREVTYWDDELPGFGLRVLASGARSWLVRYRVATTGRQQFKSLGSVQVLDVAKARKEARKLLASVETGADPRAAHEAERRKVAETVGKLVTLYVQRYVEPHQRLRSAAETRRALEAHFKPLHGRSVSGITRRDVAARLAELASTSGPVAANRARAALSAMFTWAMKQGLAESNPVVGTAKAVAEKDIARDRSLAAREIAALWRVTDGPGDYHAIVRLLLLTGQRREEVGAMRWRELDLDKALWTLPRERTKNKLPHDVPLSEPALTVLRGLPNRQHVDAKTGAATPRSLVFGTGAGGFSGWSKAKAALDGRIARLRAEARLGRSLGKGEMPEPADALPSWRLHDLRRSAVTGMAELGIQPHVIEAVVNHISGHKAGVAGVYNRATYATEKRQALDRWAAHVTALAADEVSNIVPLRAVVR